jgi:hypothetical protein
MLLQEAVRSGSTSLTTAITVVCWSGICGLGSIEIGSLGPINMLPFDPKFGFPESRLGLLPDINKPPIRTINDTQAHGQEGARADPTRAAHEAGLDVGSERYQGAMAYLIEQAALLADEHTAFDVGDQHPHGYASYFFTRRAVKLLEEG